MTAKLGETLASDPSQEARVVAVAPTMAVEPRRLPDDATIADRYRVRELLGEGGMGAVYRVHDLELDEEVALKVLREEAAQADGALERFRREVKLARRVTHPNVARTYDLGTHEGLRFLTMELVRGTSLGRRMKRESLSLGESLRVVADVLRGLSAAHAVGVVHRDLKPDNVLLETSRARPSATAPDSDSTGYGRVVITDFGIARLAEAVARSEAIESRTVGVVLGTPQYMAPEQLEGHELDGRTDIYALGCVFYELLTGEPPFAGESVYAVAAARLSKAPPDPREREASIPDPVARLVLDALARSREERPDAHAMLERIDAIRGGASPLRERLKVPSSRLEHAASRASSRGPRAVVVVPFDAQPASATGLAGDLAAAVADAIAGQRGAKLVPLATARAAVGTHLVDGVVDPLGLARALDAELAIDGSVRISGDRARVRLRLFDVARGAQGWAERVDASAEDAFALEDEVVRVVGEALAPRLSTEIARGPADKAVRALYDRAREAYAQFHYQRVAEAIGLLEQADAIAPGDPFVESLLGAALARMWLQRGADDRDLIVRAEELSLRALAADASIGETFLTIGLLRIHQGETRAGVRALHEALSRAPLLAEAHAWLGRLLCESGFVDEGERELDLALRLEPQSSLVLMDRARLHAFRGDRARREEDLDAAERAAKGSMLAMRARFGMWDRDRDLVSEVVQALEAEPSGSGLRKALPVLRAYVAKESSIGAREAFGEVAEAARASPRHRAFMYQMATEFFGANDEIESALWALEHASEPPLIDLLWLDRCPALDGLRRQAGFAKVRARVSARVAELWS